MCSTLYLFLAFSSSYCIMIFLCNFLCWRAYLSSRHLSICALECRRFYVDTKPWPAIAPSATPPPPAPGPPPSVGPDQWFACRPGSGPCNPKPAWTPTYVMAESTSMQVCNFSGFQDPASIHQWGLIDFDWVIHAAAFQGSGFIYLCDTGVC